MNAKRAKRLRRQARQMTQGKRARAYIRAADGSIRNEPATTRGTYRKLKREAMKG